MNIKKYDNKYVQLTNNENEVFEGICTYDNKEYNYHEYGRNEESIQIMNILFYKSQIKKIKELKNSNGPYGYFTKPYDTLEKMLVESGPIFIEQVFESEEDIHIYRLLLCIENYIDNKLIPQEEIDEILNLIEKLIKYNNSEYIIEEANKILNKD